MFSENKEQGLKQTNSERVHSKNIGQRPMSENEVITSPERAKEKILSEKK